MNDSARNSSSRLRGSTVRVPTWAVAMLILALGVALGFLFRGAFSQAGASGSAGDGQATASASSAPQPAAALQPLLNRLREDPNNAALLVTIGNRYYDKHDWNKAVEYYRRSLQIKPENVDVRTDMGTAIWYGGDPDGAIREYKTVLRYQPDYPQTLFNMGVVEWQGKHDGRAALKSWQTLLEQHPEYPARQKVEQLMQKVQREMKQADETSGARQ